MKFRDLLRVSVLLFGGTATALAVVSVVGAAGEDTNTLPELEPGTVLFNRLWPLIVLGLVSAAVGIFVPQVPAIATGYCLLVALLWRHQSRAVEAIEGRDGVEFWLDRSSPLGRPQLLRLPGLRKIAPE